MIRVVLPHHLRELARLGPEISVTSEGSASVSSVLDAVENAYPVLRGTIREHGTKKRRAYVRFFAEGEDISLLPSDLPLPEGVASGQEPFLVIGAIAGG